MNSTAEKLLKQQQQFPKPFFSASILVQETASIFISTIPPLLSYSIMPLFALAVMAAQRILNILNVNDGLRDYVLRIIQSLQAIQMSIMLGYMLIQVALQDSSTSDNPVTLVVLLWQIFNANNAIQNMWATGPERELDAAAVDFHTDLGEVYQVAVLTGFLGLCNWLPWSLFPATSDIDRWSGFVITYFLSVVLLLAPMFAFRWRRRGDVPFRLIPAWQRVGVWRNVNGDWRIIPDQNADEQLEKCKNGQATFMDLLIRDFEAIYFGFEKHFVSDMFVWCIDLELEAVSVLLYLTVVYPSTFYIQFAGMNCFIRLLCSDDTALRLYMPQYMAPCLAFIIGLTIQFFRWERIGAMPIIIAGGWIRRGDWIRFGREWRRLGMRVAAIFAEEGWVELVVAEPGTDWGSVLRRWCYRAENHILWPLLRDVDDDEEEGDAEMMDEEDVGAANENE